ncbi:hypothetical protein [Vogesella fluminis]|uniref:hypothetical protein n=1 Tax=Vogesella fluminis TaxID=1069161 RepID=UPI001671E537|nr:hypothetical protein [Vogesella fluminis]
MFFAVIRKVSIFAGATAKMALPAWCVPVSMDDTKTPANTRLAGVLFTKTI